MRFWQHLAAVCVAATGIAAVGIAASQEQAQGQIGQAQGQGQQAGQEQGQQMGQAQGQMGQEQGMCPADRRSPVLSVGDFNGDSIVDGADVKELAERIARRDNAAFFDINADSAVDTKDLLHVARQVGARSTPLDRELAAVFRATERYRDIGNAIADGFIPVTQSFIGRGVHWVWNEPLDDRFELTRPEGLTYSEDGELLAVFHARVPSQPAPDRPPAGYTGDEAWHSYTGACFRGLDFENPSYDWRTVSFEECVPAAECATGFRFERFDLLYVWLYHQNPCGVFAGVSPRIEEGVDVLTVGTRCPGAAQAH